MPNFKPKPNKEINVDKQATITVDSKHKEMMDKFTNGRRMVQQLRRQCKLIEKNLEENRHLYTVDTILALKDEMDNLITRITRIESEEKDYLLGNSKYLFDYFLKKQDIETNQNKKKSVAAFFNIGSSSGASSGSGGVVIGTSSNHIITEHTNHSITETATSTSVGVHRSLTDSVTATLSTNITSIAIPTISTPVTVPKEDPVHKYMSTLDESFITLSDFTTVSNVCNSCGGEIVPITNEGMTVCKKCGIQRPYIIDQNQHSGKEPPKEVSFYAYKRINHFREILAQVQGKETTTVSDEVIESIKAQMRRERISIEEMTNEKTKTILKNLGYNKYYEHIPFIKEKLGIKPPVMPVELEQKLCNLFLEIQKPYAKFCPDERVNFLNYYYVLYKMCELLEADEYLDHFYMLKDPVKRMEQDEIWKKICKELNWEFIPTP